MAEQQKFTVKVSSKYEETERLAIGLEIIDRILERTAEGKDKKGDDFAGYSESYIKSLDFSLAGKSKGKVNLSLSGEMLGAIEVLDVGKSGEITIGIPADDTFNNGKAEGNIKGTYGQDKPVRDPKTGKIKKRDFMGISRKDLKEITTKYKINNQENRDEARTRALELLTASQIASGLIDQLDPGSEDNG